jgi:hypothetical protein
MPLPESFIQHLRDFGYHPRSNKHSNAFSATIVQDLLEACPPLAEQARQGKLVYALNMRLRVRTVDWNVDLVLGTPGQPVPTLGAPIVQGVPATVRMAIEIKGVMTEHRKAVKNRKRDFEAHHEHVHNYGRRAIAAGVMVVNAALRFRSPLRTGPTAHGARLGVSKIVEHCVNEMRNVTESGGASAHGIDAKAALVVDFDNVDWAAARYFSQPPAPQPGDPLHYDSFIQKLCDEYSTRFGAS